ncbi:beta-xylosidase [Aspergillus clavatus NRRL 1]|uniref:Beta-xylosidase n=1 Tax=Aspergillus clavatus (strain ATCC 1007 / CBS 513.65 / DSM 816 / NCTC 3887 / NRRL 1 / QM 1276 / 107) TaxID=344612 RepID=A1CN91_ASPCL|nr:beta-xylosidase [Aspergillus clavatus NRRL 1]EAW07112.1 beta-xylosidase [Aspergillus clavatus NRRL 1]
MPSQYTNPILPGFYPDPACILVGDTFYLINSSFQFFPGLPIHKSKDLINWELIGNAICRPEQIQLHSSTTKVNNAAEKQIFTGGLYAPTIRYHNGRFYIVCTMLSGPVDMPAAADFEPQNFIITASDLEDPSSFSDPIYFDFYGIDPSLFFDDDGRVYVQGSWIHGYRKNPATVIRQAEIDLSTGKLAAPAVDIWSGHTGRVPEGPHLYKKDGYYYLLIAEGGTFGEHKITMARARSVWGPYESFSGNPVLTAEGSNGCIQCVGHAELFQDPLGQWWAVMLAGREYGASYPLGRETFLTPVEWPENQFPSFAPVELSPKCSRQMPGRVASHTLPAVSLDSPLTLYLRTPDLQNYAQNGKEITLTPVEADLGSMSGTMTFVGQRQTSLESVARVLLRLGDLPAGKVSCGLAVYKDPFRYASVTYSTADGCFSLTIQEPGKPLTTLGSIPVQHATAAQLSITSSTENYVFECSLAHTDGDTETTKLGEVPCSALSGDDFTGTIYAIFASGEGDVKFHDFKIQN